MNKKIAMVFPGQGSQYVGMGSSLYAESQMAKDFFCRAEDVLGFPLRKLCFEGPLEELTDTRIAQPAILTVSYILFTLLKENGIHPDWVAGHSLGEYTALLAAEALSFETALSLVKRRAELMASVPGNGGMVAVLNTPRPDLEEQVDRLKKEGVIVLANHNSPAQIVVSGEKPLIQKLADYINEEKKGKAIILKVSGAFHSPMMVPAAEKLHIELERVDFSVPTVPIVANVSAKPVTSHQELPALLEKQVYSPVLWEESLKKLKANGCQIYLEVGGKVLTGLIKKTLKGVTTHNVIEMNDLKKVLAILEEV